MLVVHSEDGPGPGHLSSCSGDRIGDGPASAQPDKSNKFLIYSLKVPHRNAWICGKDIFQPLEFFGSGEEGDTGLTKVQSAVDEIN